MGTGAARTVEDERAEVRVEERARRGRKRARVREHRERRCVPAGPREDRDAPRPSHLSLAFPLLRSLSSAIALARGGQRRDTLRLDEPPEERGELCAARAPVRGVRRLERGELRGRVRRRAGVAAQVEEHEAEPVCGRERHERAERRCAAALSVSASGSGSGGERRGEGREGEREGPGAGGGAPLWKHVPWMRTSVV